MLSRRASWGGFFFLVVIAGSGATTTACFERCSEVREGCAEFGDLDTSTCNCIPWSTYNRPEPPAPVFRCTSDVECSYPTHCRQPPGPPCGDAGAATGTCTSSVCASDLDCHPDATCTIDGPGYGICEPACGPDGGCSFTGQAECSVDADCRASQGATCYRGWCYGPVSADGGDAGSASCGG